MPFDAANDIAAPVDPADFEPQGQLDSQDISILASSVMGTGVLSGCGVTAQGGTSMGVDYASGEVVVAGARGLVTAGSVALTASSVFPVFYLIYADSAGAITAASGTAASVAVFPTIPVDATGNPSRAVLAAVYVPAGATDINTINIKDRRVFIQPPVWETSVADANYTMLPTDRCITYTSITAARTVTLTQASAVPVGWEVTIRDTSGLLLPPTTAANQVDILVDAAGADTINGQTEDSITQPNGFLVLRSNGVSKWQVISSVACHRFGFATSGTVNPLRVPKGVTYVRFLLVGAGGGGGSGRRDSGANNKGGGGGGQGGAILIGSIRSDLITQQASERILNIVVGTGGTGGTAASANAINGNPGGDGGDTTMSDGTRTFTATGGAGGTGGSATAGTGGNGVQRGTYLGQSGGNSSISTNANCAGNSSAASVAPDADIASQMGCAGGGAGGGMSSGGTKFNGGGGGPTPAWTFSLAGGAGGSALGTGSVPNGTSGVSPTTSGISWPIGTGGGGGGPGTSTAGTSGTGGRGCGGGGGPAGTGTTTAGGNGGPGFVEILFER